MNYIHVTCTENLKTGGVRIDAIRAKLNLCPKDSKSMCGHDMYLNVCNKML